MLAVILHTRNKFLCWKLVFLHYLPGSTMLPLVLHAGHKFLCWEDLPFLSSWQSFHIYASDAKSVTRIFFLLNISLTSGNVVICVYYYNKIPEIR